MNRQTVAVVGIFTGTLLLVGVLSLIIASGDPDNRTTAISAELSGTSASASTGPGQKLSDGCLVNMGAPAEGKLVTPPDPTSVRWIAVADPVTTLPVGCVPSVLLYPAADDGAALNRLKAQSGVTSPPVPVFAKDGSLVGYWGSADKSVTVRTDENGSRSASLPPDRFVGLSEAETSGLVPASLVMAPPSALEYDAK